MESDLSLINRIKNGDGGDSLTSLIERHSGIYVYVVDQFTKNPNSLIDRDTIMKEKDHTIFIAALNYNPDCKSKFSTYLANEAKWKCLNAISKAKRRRETSFEDIKNDPASEEDSCQHLIKVESFNFFKNMLNEENKMIDVGEADQVETEIDLDKPAEQAKPVEEEKVEVEQVEEKPVETKTEETKDEKADELKTYSEGVQKRIAKLTRKMREAERQREEAVAFADAVNKQKSELEGRLSKLDKSYTSEFESRVKNSMVAAKQALKTAIESQDVEGQIAAQEQIANLTMDAARLNAMKVAEESKPKEVNVTPQQTKHSRTRFRFFRKD